MPDDADSLDPVEVRIWRAWRELRRGPGWRRIHEANFPAGAGPVLESAQIDALEAIVDNEPVAMGNLAVLLGIDSSTATRAVEKLEAKQLVKRQRRSTNARFVEVVPTSRGTELLDRLVRSRRRTMHVMLEEFDRDERDQLAALLERLALGLAKVIPE
jgi:DNA-binding MarR family transcriptional regulator